jgi:hypothetical protein
VWILPTKCSLFTKSLYSEATKSPSHVTTHKAFNIPFYSIFKINKQNGHWVWRIMPVIPTTWELLVGRLWSMMPQTKKWDPSWNTIKSKKGFECGSSDKSTCQARVRPWVQPPVLL